MENNDQNQDSSSDLGNENIITPPINQQNNQAAQLANIYTPRPAAHEPT